MDKSDKIITTKVKNKAPAAIQITAEQLIREAKERELEVIPPAPIQKISDPVELKEYQLRKRKEFEDNLRKNKNNVSHWIKYANWEDTQKCIDRARSIFERALDNYGSRNISIWLKYIELEVKHQQTKHARTIFDRAVYILPKVSQFWFKYVNFEENLGNIDGCRAIFERWIKFLPGEQEWKTYINFEMRYKEIDKAREVYSKYVMLHPELTTWIKFARFEERHTGQANARQVYELALEFFGETKVDETLYIAFAQFEERQYELERARLIYDYALKKLPKEKALLLYESYVTFQKKHGCQKDIENLISHKRKLMYEETLAESPKDYDTWFDYIKLAEDEFTQEEIRDIYERAIACIPDDKENKDEWRRYIYLWIYYATFEEVDAQDMEKALKVYSFCLEELIPHEEFTFAKIWLAAAKLQVRMNNIDQARLTLEKSLTLCPKRKLFKEYIELEIQLREFDRCRKLYQRFLQKAPRDSLTWINYAELEAIIMQTNRARAIYKLAISRSEMDSPELIWKAFIDFEIEHLKQDLEMIFEDKDIIVNSRLDEISRRYDKVESLYEDLLEKTNHVKVWKSYAEFYIGLIDFYKNLKCNEEYDGKRSLLIDHLKLKARNVFERASDRLKEDEPLCRIVLLEAWQNFESSIPNGLDISQKMPTKTMKRKQVDDDEWEEYYEYSFPEDKRKMTGLLERVKKWKATVN